MSDTSIDVEIEHLILEGIEDRHRKPIVDAVRRELARLIARSGMPQHLQRSQGKPPRASRVAVVAGQAPAGIGASVARAIYRGEA